MEYIDKVKEEWINNICYEKLCLFFIISMIASYNPYNKVIHFLKK